MVRPQEAERKERHTGKPGTSVKAPPRKAGGGGKWSVGQPGRDELAGGIFNRNDPNFDPDERRVDPEDGVAYKFDQLAAFYKGKYTSEAIAEYWEHECAIVAKSRKQKKEQQASGPTVADSAGIVSRAKAKAAAKTKPSRAKKLTLEDMAVDGRLAKEIAAVIPHYPYKNMENYYDFQGLLAKPRLFNAMCSVIAKRYRRAGATKIAAFESRGFLLAPVCIKLGLPFVLLHKDVKLPDSIATDELAVRKGCFAAGDKVILIDDVLFTGKTLHAGVELIKKCGAEVLECGVVVEVKASKGRDKCIAAGAKDVFGFISDELFESLDAEKKAKEEKETKEKEAEA